MFTIFAQKYRGYIKDEEFSFGCPFCKFKTEGHSQEGDTQFLALDHLYLTHQIPSVRVDFEIMRRQEPAQKVSRPPMVYGMQAATEARRKGDLLVGDLLMTFNGTFYSWNGRAWIPCKDKEPTRNSMTTGVLVTSRDINGDWTTSMVHGDDPEEFARWAVKEFPNSIYTLVEINTYI